MLVVTKGHTYLEVLVEGLLEYVWHFVTGIKGLKGVLEIFKEWTDKIRSVPLVEFFEKAVLKNFEKFLENHLQQSAYWKLITMLNMSSVADVFWRISKKYSEQLF